jgi:diaminopimelate decarboxylase
MADTALPFSRERIEKIIETHPTPFHIYDERGIRENAGALKKAFSWCPSFREFFAVKACPNPSILTIMKEEGFGADTSSLSELILSERVGLSGEMVMFSSNDTPAGEFVKARAMGAIINLDDIGHIPFLQRHAGMPEVLSFRYNPGPLMEGGNRIIGKPEESKYGCTRDQLFECYRIVRGMGVKRFGLHTMVASNELDVGFHIQTARMLFHLIRDISKELGMRFEFVNLGGGFGIPYAPHQEPIDLSVLSAGIRAAYDELIRAEGLDPISICMESGRAMTGPFGFLVSRVIHLKHTFRDYVGLDASMANLMRPAFYGAYHHITVLGKEHLPADRLYDVTGSLCENNDKFAVNRMLPAVEEGDIVVIHDTGAHGHAMGFNYNGKLRSAELLLKPDGSVRLIRRAETVEDYFRTMEWPGI